MQRHKHRDNERLSRISLLSCGSILDCLPVMKIRHMQQGDQCLVVVCVWDEIKSCWKISSSSSKKKKNPPDPRLFLSEKSKVWSAASHGDQMTKTHHILPLSYSGSRSKRTNLVHDHRFIRSNKQYLCLITHLFFTGCTPCPDSQPEMSLSFKQMIHSLHNNLTVISLEMMYSLTYMTLRPCCPFAAREILCAVFIFLS